MMHSRRYFFKALDSDEQWGRPASDRRLNSIENAKGLAVEERLGLRQRLSAPVMAKLTIATHPVHRLAELLLHN